MWSAAGFQLPDLSQASQAFSALGNQLGDAIQRAKADIESFEHGTIYEAEKQGAAAAAAGSSAPGSEPRVGSAVVAAGARGTRDRVWWMRVCAHQAGVLTALLTVYVVSHRCP